MHQGDVLFWIWLAEALGPACKHASRLLTLYDNPYDLFCADEAELERIDGLPERICTALSNKNLQHASEILDLCVEKGVSVLPYGDRRFPLPLREISNPPVVLYYVGELPSFNDHLCVAMVGTRQMSAYGLHSAYRISYDTAKANAVVVSGMAAGIDGVCAAAAIAAGGKTVAVLGCGVDVVYPKHHSILRDEIVKHGAVMSEYPPTTSPRNYHFPARNRIISGISQVTVVLEAGLKSGSLITAKEAILQGKTVYALPANVGSRGAEGTNGLLREGISPILEARDALEPFRYLYADTLKIDAMLQDRAMPRADMHQLEALGVIELTPPAEKVAPATEMKIPGGRRSANTNTKKSSSRRTEEDAPKKGEKPADESARQDGGATPDAILSSLPPKTREIFLAMPDDRAISTDALCAMGYVQSDVLSSMTTLEIMGLIEKLPGALFTKA